MITAALVFAGLAAAVHIYIFVLESLLWTAPRTRAVFGTTAEEAATTKLLAFNQGFYNLFLALITIKGIVLMVLGYESVGAAVVFAGVGPMLAAAVVLVFSARNIRAAVVQGLFPLLAVVLLAVAVLR